MLPAGGRGLPLEDQHGTAKRNLGENSVVNGGLVERKPNSEDEDMV